jgi:hypothetical protein
MRDGIFNASIPTMTREIVLRKRSACCEKMGLPSSNNEESPMNTKLTVMIAAMCMSASVFAQTQPTGQSTTAAGTSNTGTPTVGQSTNNSGEQNATTMQNNSNTQNTATPRNAQRKTDKAMQQSKVNADCAQGHTDGHATAPTHSGTTTAEGCDTKTIKR